MPLRESELILNADGSVYHLNLHPEDIADTIITVGDPERVARVSHYFDVIELKKTKREFVTHTGYVGRKRLTVLSTGIGTGNIDIVMNELDALANIDFKTRIPKSTPTQLTFLRLGTSGAIQPDIAVDSLLLSEMAIGLDGLLQFYEPGHLANTELETLFNAHLTENQVRLTTYAVNADAALQEQLASAQTTLGITVTNAGFYGPQSRSLRIAPKYNSLNEVLRHFSYNGLRITNLEMETAGILALAKLLGHRAASLNAILANRHTNRFSSKPDQTVDTMIQYALSRLT